MSVRGKLVREVSFSLIGLGVLFGGLGALSLATIPPQAPPLHGLPRSLVFGIPLVTAGGVQLACGILLLATNRALFGGVGALAAALVAVMAFVLTGITLINGLLAAVPLLIAQRLSLLAKAVDADPPR
jgi:hypothetical protein